MSSPPPPARRPRHPRGALPQRAVGRVRQPARRRGAPAGRVSPAAGGPRVATPAAAAACSRYWRPQGVGEAAGRIHCARYGTFVACSKLRHGQHLRYPLVYWCLQSSEKDTKYPAVCSVSVALWQVHSWFFVSSKPSGDCAKRQVNEILNPEVIVAFVRRWFVTLLKIRNTSDET